MNKLYDISLDNENKYDIKYFLIGKLFGSGK